MLLNQPPVEVRWLRVGHCTQLEALSRRGGPWRTIEFPALCAAIRHPEHGWTLFDTGYAGHFFEATAHLPERIYRTLLPVRLTEQESLAVQLRALGTHPTEVRRVVVSHFHGDHVAGLRDLPNARVIAGRAGIDQALALTGMRALRHGLLPALLPDDLSGRLDPAEAHQSLTFGGLAGWDLLGDQSLVAVALPGHMAGHLGLLLTTTDGRQVLLAGDAAWSTKAIRELSPPNRIVGAGFDDWPATLGTLGLLNAFAQQGLTILPSHCTEAWRAWNS